MLEGRRILITGVLTRDSIAFATARRAQELGAEVILTGFGRTKRMTERSSGQLPQSVDVLELDVNNPEDVRALHGDLTQRWGRIDGLLHAIAFAPPDALGGGFLDAPLDSAQTAFQTSAYSLKALVGGLLDLLEAPPDGAGVVGLDFDATVAWPAYDWMGVAKAALEAVTRYLARDVGSLNVRVNLVSAGPVQTLAAGGIPGLRAPGRRVGGAGAARVGPDRRRAGRRRGLLSALAARAPDHRRDPARRRRLSRRWAVRARRTRRLPEPPRGAGLL